jgi:hypothetical protein
MVVDEKAILETGMEKQSIKYFESFIGILFFISHSLGIELLSRAIV